MFLRLPTVTLREGLCSGSGVIRKRQRNSVDAAYVRFLRSLLRITLRERQSIPSEERKISTAN
jgi:hypothetical protein